jgi:hypothetical protein
VPVGKEGDPLGTEVFSPCCKAKAMVFGSAGDGSLVETQLVKPSLPEDTRQVQAAVALPRYAKTFKRMHKDME